MLEQKAIEILTELKSFVRDRISSREEKKRQDKAMCQFYAGELYAYREMLSILENDPSRETIGK